MDIKISKKEAIDVVFPGGIEEDMIRLTLTRLRSDARAENVAAVFCTFNLGEKLSDWCTASLILMFSELSDHSKHLMIRKSCMDRFRLVKNADEVYDFCTDVAY